MVEAQQEWKFFCSQQIVWLNLIIIVSQVTVVFQLLLNNERLKFKFVIICVGSVLVSHENITAWIFWRPMITR